MVTEIENFLNQKITNRLLKLDSTVDSYGYRTDDDYGVLIPFNDPNPILLRFSSASLRNMQINGDFSGNYLYFSCSDESYLHQFSVLCEDFLDPQNIDVLKKDPFTWWENWKMLLGNSIYNDAVYPVIAELVLYLSLLRKNEPDVIWKGPDGALHDIETSSCSYEVKSTLTRNERVVNISSIDQLAIYNNKPLYLAYFIFEPRSSGGYSLEKCVDSFTDTASREFVLKKLGKLHVEPGTPNYKQEFALLGAYLYPVNRDFPAITRAQLESLHIDNRIQSISYKVNIMGLECSDLKEHFNLSLL
jgi:hypothetical protein